MSQGKREEVRLLVERLSRRAINELCADMKDRGKAEQLLAMRVEVVSAIAHEIWREYSFFELADIMEWKTRRVRR